MKPSGLLLAASVVGAVAIGGAVTGSTLAAWQDQATLADATIQAGSIGLTVNESVAAELPALSGLAPGESRYLPLTFRNTGSGSNLRLVVVADSVTSSNATGVPLSFGHRRSNGADDDCSGGEFSSLSSGAQLTQTLPVDGSERICLRVTSELSALPASAQAATVTLTFRGTQVLP